MKTGRVLALFVTLLLAAACSKQEAGPASVPPPPPAPPSPEQLSAMTVGPLQIDPPAASRRQPLSVTAEVRNAPRGTVLTLAWFGPNGWLVYDDSRQFSGDAVTFTVPPLTFPETGTYHAELRADAVVAGDANVSITD